MNGQISDLYTIIPQFKGNYPIKPMSFSYFDLGSGRYKTITSPEIMINVLDGPSASENAVVTNSGVSKMRVTAGEQFHFIKLKTNLSDIKEDDFFGSTLFDSLMILPFLAIPMIVLFKRKKEAIDADVYGNKIKMNNRLAKNIYQKPNNKLITKSRFILL